MPSPPAAAAPGAVRPGARRRKGLVAGLVILALAVVLVPLRWHHKLPGRARAFVPPKTVLVTGASGRTGRLVVERLLERGTFSVRAFVRSERARQDLLKFAPALSAEQVFIGDALKPASLVPALAGCDALIIVTSAIPRIRVLSLAKTLLAKFFLRKKLRPKFGWKGNVKPEQADWEGQRNQVDTALQAGVSRIVVVGSMGGTQQDNFLNSIGEGDGDNILVWKRKAEMYLIDRCKTSGTATYTIIHPGGLLDTPGGERRVVLGVDDELLERPVRSIPRADVAELCVQALEWPEARDRSFDACADPPAKIAADAQPSSGHQPTLQELLAELKGRDCDYTLNVPQV